MNKVKEKYLSKSGNNPLRDVSLIERAKQGHLESREILANACMPRVRKLVHLSYSSSNDYDDVVQIAMVTIFRDLPGLRSCSHFLGWIDKVVYNVVRQEGRKRVRLTNLFSLVEKTPDTRNNHITPEDNYLGDVLINVLNGHLSAIKSKKRTAAIMSTFFGYVDTEVADLMGCSTETAKKRIQAGRRELFKKIEKDDKCTHLFMAKEFQQ
ncbi:MAG: RNA polymerase sigma factor [Deltaproteobacteria bacterium]|nr:RNA polymerase sigma factor [Deltaproteobacteria bacterium]